MAIFSERLCRALDEVRARQMREWAALSPARRLELAEQTRALGVAAGTWGLPREDQPLELWLRVVTRLRGLAASRRPA